MNYELAKELKEAGFPQKESLYSPEEDLNIYEVTHGVKSSFKEAVYVPTLSELIEACGANFRNINRDTFSDTGWQANTYHSVHGNKNFEYGETPEEAVARLWLALNKK